MYPRPETPGSWQVLWRTEKGRRYRTFPSLAEANYFASEMQRERRTNGARVAHGLMSPEDLKAWAEFREYNTLRPHSALRYLTPAEFAAKRRAELRSAHVPASPSLANPNQNNQQPNQAPKALV